MQTLMPQLRDPGWARVVRIVRSGEVIAPGAAKDADTVLEDHTGPITRLYRCGQTALVLLRPDGHLDMRARHPETARLRDWLASVLEGDDAPASSRWRPAHCAPA